MEHVQKGTQQTTWKRATQKTVQITRVDEYDEGIANRDRPASFFLGELILF
jgi:hypothetical protein